MKNSFHMITSVLGISKSEKKNTKSTLGVQTTHPAFKIYFFISKDFCRAETKKCHVVVRAWRFLSEETRMMHDYHIPQHSPK